MPLRRRFAETEGEHRARLLRIRKRLVTDLRASRYVGERFGEHDQCLEIADRDIRYRHVDAETRAISLG